MVTSCFTPSSKETYLGQYERFIDNVGKNCKNYNKKDWNYADQRYEKFSSEWYNLYRDEFTTADEIKVVSLAAKYQSYKGGDLLYDFYDKVLKKDVRDLKKKIEYYIDNDMDEDLEKLKEGAKEIGDSTLKVVEDIIKEIRD
jgi:hypothetical protein